MLPTAAVGLGVTNLMEIAVTQPPRPPKGYVHYTHTDACSLSRWNARENYEFMYSKPWQKVNDFYLDMVNGSRSLSDLFAKDTYAVHDDGAEIIEDFDSSELVTVRTKEKRTGRWARANFKIMLSYHGDSFDGWQKQPGLNTVQVLIESCFGKFVDERNVQLLKEKKLPVDGCVLVAGRTDKGVTALEQVCSFYTWRADVKVQDIEDSINSVAPGKIKVISVSQVSRDFHPNFSAKWRHYFYIFPFKGEILGDESNQCNKTIADAADSQDGKYQERFGTENLDDGDENEKEAGEKPANFNITDVNQPGGKITLLQDVCTRPESLKKHWSANRVFCFPCTSCRVPIYPVLRMERLQRLCALNWSRIASCARWFEFLWRQLLGKQLLVRVRMH